MIACRTTIGFGAPTKAGKASSHGSPLGAEEIAGARKALGWSEAPFEVPADVRELWRTAGKRGQAAHAAWSQRLQALAADKRADFERRLAGKLPAALAAAVLSVKKQLAAAPKEIASRIASERALEAITAAVPEMIGGSADLTGSNNTRTKAMKAMSASDYAARFIHYGVREHGMAAAMNGMALHGGIIPYSGTFLAFADYCRPAIRLAALMEQRVIHVMTHDSIGLGEDGPTHQPVEHVASLRAIPNLLVFRPCDAVETAECWQLALEAHDRPSVLALTRQNLPQLRREMDESNLCAGGAYEIVPADGRAQVSLFASGSEVVDRGRGAQAAVGTRRAGARCLGAMSRPAHGSAGAHAPGRDRQRAGQCCRRSRHPAGLGRHYRIRWRLCRHDRLSAPARRSRTSTSISGSRRRPSRMRH